MKTPLRIHIPDSTAREAYLAERKGGEVNPDRFKGAEAHFRDLRTFSEAEHIGARIEAQHQLADAQSKLDTLKALIEARYNAAALKDDKPEVAAALREILEHFRA